MLTFQYLHMTHYFSDPLSVISADRNGMELQTQHFDAIRVLPSFKRLVNAQAHRLIELKE